MHLECTVGKTCSALTLLRPSWASNGAFREIMIIIDLMSLDLCINIPIFLIIEQYPFPTVYDFKRSNGYDTC